MNWPWAELGIAPTDDPAALRRAYAVRLKAIDVEADPAAFSTLRDAFDDARHRQRCGWLDPSNELPLVDDLADAPPLVARPVAPTPRPVSQDQVEAIADLVFGDRRDAGYAPQLEARANRLLTSPEMESVAHAADIEHWLADLIVQNIPRTNALLAPAINRFGWLAAAEQWSCPPAVLGAVRRYRDLQYRENIAGQPYGTGLAWRLLTRPGIPQGSDSLSLVDGFLRELATDHPTLLHDLDPALLESWQTRIARREAGWPRRTRRALDRRTRPIRAAWRWCRASLWRLIPTLYLAPFVPALLVAPFSGDTAAALAGLAMLWAGLFTWIVLTGVVRWAFRKIAF